MAKINLEKLLIDLVQILNKKVRNPYEPCVDAYDIKNALSRQGYKISRKGELIGVDEEEPEEPRVFLVYDKEKDKFEETNEEPPLEKDLDYFVQIAGTNMYIRQSDYMYKVLKDLKL